MTSGAMRRVPSLRDALAPADPPVELDYRTIPRMSLMLRDDHGYVLGDPVKEFVADVFAWISAHADVLAIARARGRVAPTAGQGTALDLDELHEMLGDLRPAAARLQPLAGHSLAVELPITVPRLPNANIHINGTPRVGIVTAEEPMPPAVDAALSDYTAAIASVTDRLARGSFGPWLLDSGITSLDFVGHFTVPELPRRDVDAGATPLPRRRSSRRS